MFSFFRYAIGESFETQTVVIAKLFIFANFIR